MPIPSSPSRAPATDRGPLIAIGASSRALAESCLRAGYDPIALDLFADTDLRARCRAMRVPRDRFPHGLPELVAALPAAPVVWTGALENHSPVLAAIGASRRLYGTPPGALSEARDPQRLRASLRSAKLCAPQLAGPGDALDPRKRWLVKPLAGAGGLGIRFATERRVPVEHYGQEFVPGTPASIVAIAVPQRSTLVLGGTRQLIGTPWLGAGGFRYAGSVGPLAFDRSLAERLERAAVAVARDFEIAGLFGLDFVIAPDGEPWFVELNPRYTASVEVIERATGEALIAKHVACFDETGNVASQCLAPLSCASAARAWGKAILWADRPRRVRVRLLPELALGGELEPGFALADVPAPGEAIQEGYPIATVLVSRSTPAEVLADLPAAARAARRLLLDAADLDEEPIAPVGEAAARDARASSGP